MATEQQLEAMGTQHSAHVVGSAFVQQYYHILHQSPELVYRFYQDTSKLGRSEDDGAMIPVSTMEAINEKIMSLGYDKYKAEIKTVDAQDSLDGSVLVLVTGYLTKEDGSKRNFTQSFFLATQEKGYFVLNDIFRYVDVVNIQQECQTLQNYSQQRAHEQVSFLNIADNPPPEEPIAEQSVPPEEEEEANVEEVCDPSDVDEGSVLDDEIPSNNVADELFKNNVADEAPNSSHVIMEPFHIAVQEETPKKSYASIVKVMKENVIHLPASTTTFSKKLPERQEWQVSSATAPSAVAENTSSSVGTPKNVAVPEAADGFSIYIKNLPMNATSAQLEQVFKKFGPIKFDGIQVRSHKYQGVCFGFVEFEDANAVENALRASPIMIGGHEAYVEEKQAGGSRVNTRSRYPPGRGFIREGARGRGSYGGRGYGRGDHGNRIDGRGGSLTANRPGSSPSPKDGAQWVPTS